MASRIPSQEQILQQQQQQLQPKKSILERFRLNGVRPSKVLITSVADVVGDWIFYRNVRSVPGLKRFELFVFVFCIVSSGMGFLVFVSMYMNFFHTKSNVISNRAKHCPFGQFVKTALGLEVIVEDIPQFILTVLISKELGVLSTYAVFNFTTSGINFFFNLLDMIEIEDHHHDSQET